MNPIDFLRRCILASLLLAGALPVWGAPAINQITPSSGPTAGGNQITITGSGFGSSALVQVGGRLAVPVVLSSDTMVIATAPAGEGIDQPVQVIAGGTSSNQKPYSYNAPVISQITPASAGTAGGTVITLTGSSFGLSPTVTFNGNGVSLLSASHTQITFSLPSGQGTALPIVVTAAAQSSPAISFSYDPPVLSSISATSAPTAGGVPITVFGSNFGLSPVVRVGGTVAPASPTGNQTHNQLVVLLPEGDGIARPVTVQVEARISNSLPFSYAPPEITSISAASAPTSGNVPITINGNNFGLNPTATIGGNPLPIVSGSVSHSRIICTLPAGQGTDRPIVVTAALQSSPSFSFNYDPPILSSISATSAPTAGGIPITVFGSNFGLSPVVRVGGTIAPASPTGNQTHNQLVVLLPEGDGIARPVTVQVEARISNSLPFSYAPPAITSISAASAPTSGNVPITINGNNFGLNPTASIGGNPLPIVSGSVSHNQIICTLPAGQGTDRPIVVTTASQSSTSFSFNYDPPVLSSISATSAPTAGGVPITVFGSNFGLSPVVRVGGTIAPASPTGNQTHNQLVVLLPEGDGIARPVTVQVEARISNSLPFSYAPPAITSISAASAPTSGNVPITINGNNFGLNPTATIGGNPLPIVSGSVSHSRIICTLPAGQGTDRPIMVTTALQSSAPFPFSYDPPSITGINPSTGPTAGNVPITIVGSGFGLDPVVKVGSKIATLISADHDQIQFTLPPGEGTNHPVTVTSGVRVSNSVAFVYAAPFLSSISPTSGPIRGGTVITIQGLNFGLTPSVTIGGKPAPATDVSHTVILCTLPAGNGQNLLVRINVAGQVSNALTFSYETESFADWSSSVNWGGLDSSLPADPRGTGWTNLECYAFGVDPPTANGGEIASRSPRVYGRPALSRNAMGRLQLSFWRRASAAFPDLSYQVQFGDSPAEPDWEIPALAPAIEVVDEVWEYCVFTDHSGGTGRRFGRVKLTVTPE